MVPVTTRFFSWLLVFLALLAAPFAVGAAPATLSEDFTDNLDGTVTHRITGLTWMRCSMGQTWTGSTCDATASGYTWDQANALTGATNFAGKSDWRLPNIRELHTVVDRTRWIPVIDAAVFPNTSSSYYWTASANTKDSVGAWGVAFDQGNDFYSLHRSGSAKARLVRGGQPVGSLNLARPTTDYVDNSDGTVRHIPTGLTWMRCAVGQTWTGSTCSGEASAMNWDSARARITSFAGQSDWRLPTAEELLSLVDYTLTTSSKINPTMFPASSDSNFWSASLFSSASDHASFVSFADGDTDAGGISSAFYTRLVRGGPSPASFPLKVTAVGSGTISSTPAGIACGSQCSTSFSTGTSVTLVATSANGSRFTGWDYACKSISATSCTVNMTAAKSAKGTFELITFAPGAPTGISATAGDTQVTVSFSAPLSNGGAAINHYTVTALPGGKSVSGTSSPITITGLTNGTAYTFTVTATNSAGTSFASTASNSATPVVPANPIVSGFTPPSGTVGVPYIITVSGNNLPSTLIVNIDGQTTGCSRLSTSATQGLFSCPSDLVGARLFKVQTDTLANLGKVIYTGTFTVNAGVTVAVTPKLAVGEFHSVMLRNDGTVFATGDNAFGQLGDGSTSNRSTPTLVANLVQVNAIAAQGSRTIALKQDGTVWAWGDNSRGQLGDGTTISRSVPAALTNLSNIIAISAGGGALGSHTLALKQDGTVWAWGSNEYAQLGDGTTISRSSPAQVANLTNVIAITAGWSHSLALKQDGTVWAWGYNSHGQLGDGNSGYEVRKNIPAQVMNLTNVTAIAAGSSYSLALKQDGTVWAWGYNAYGQLGDGSYVDRSTPTKMLNLDNVSAFAAGFARTLALKKDGTVWQVGSDFWALDASSSTPDVLYKILGQLSYAIYEDGERSSSNTVVRVSDLNGVTGIAAGGGRSFATTLALKQDGTVWGMGGNESAQLGDGTLTERLTTVLMSNPSANGPLDLMPGISKDIPSDKLPPFWAKVTKAKDVSAAITYSNADLGKTGSVYVVAYLKPDSPLLTGAAAVAGLNAKPPRTKDTGCANVPVGTIPAVLTRGGWKQSDCVTPTQPLYSGTLDTSTNSFNMYEASKFGQTKGDNGLFCVGYASASNASAKGLIRSVVSAGAASFSPCPSIQIGATLDIDVAAPSIPMNITATAAGPGQVNLSWSAATDNVGVDHYNIYRGITLIATLYNVTTYIDGTPQASTAYSYSVMACDAAANCSGQSTPAQIATPAQPYLTLGSGWNLVGNGGGTAMNVASLFGDASKIYSLWKWVKAGTTPGITYPNWALYTPGQSDSGAAYAASMGYDTFSSIASGEGFWVNSKTPFSVPMTAPAWILSSVFAPNQSNALTSGWNLIATGEAHTASAFNKAVGATPPTGGVIPINLTSLWAWQNSTQRWYFYAPSLEGSSGLNAYLGEKNYLDLGSISLAPTTGLWVNKP
jgi:alpha-tubulin suppressor-like RCC1 family protein